MAGSTAVAKLAKPVLRGALIKQVTPRQLVNINKQNQPGARDLKYYLLWTVINWINQGPEIKNITVTLQIIQYFVMLAIQL